MIELPWAWDDVYARASNENRAPVDVEKLGTPGAMRFGGSPMPSDWLLLSPHDDDAPTWDVEEGDIVHRNQDGVREAFRVVEVFDAGGLLVAPVKDGDADA